MSARTLFRGFFWGLIALLLVVHVGGGWYYSSRMIDDMFTPDPDAIELPEGDYTLSEVTYDSPLGDMDAWYLPAPGTIWVIHIHGLNATPAEPEVLFAPLQDAGYPQLAITYRNDEGQPSDPSGYHGYGSTEWEDIQGSVDFARDNGASEIVFAGYGAGASLALYYVYRHNFDDIGGVITDSGSIDIGWTIDHQGSQESLPLLPLNVPPTITWVAKFFTSLRIDVNWRTLDYIDRAERSLRVPVLALHGADDESVPVEQSLALQEANPELVNVVVVEGAGHVESFEAEYDRYVDEVLSFLEEVS